MSYQSEVLADAPVAFWRMDDTSGTAVAATVGPNGTYVGAPVFSQPGKDDLAVYLPPGAANYATLPFTPTSDFTLEMWWLKKPGDTSIGLFRDSTTSGTSGWFILTNGSTVSLRTSGVNRSTSTPTAPYTDGAWHHWVLSWDHWTIRLYIDGVEQWSQSGLGNGALPASPLYIGIGGPPPSGDMPGVYDGVAVYDYALPAERVAAHYAAGNPTGSSSGTVAVTLPSLTAAVSGTAPLVGSADATLPALSASVAGETSGADHGAVDATLPALTASIDGTVVEPTTGSIDIGLPRLRASILDGGTLAMVLEAGSTLDLDTVTVPTFVSETLDLNAGSSLDIDAGSVLDVTVVGAMDLDAGSMLRITMPRDWGEDPRTGRPAYRVKIVTRDGAGVVELDKVTIGVETEGRNAPDSWSFTVARANKKAQKVMAVTHQAQLWRGKIMLTKGDITPGRVDGSRITYEVKDPSAVLFGKRVIGRIPKRQLLKNADFRQGLAWWTGTYGPDSALKAPPTARIVDDDYALSGKAIELGAVDKVVTTKVDVQTSAVFVPNKATYLSGGEQKIKDVGANIPEGAVVRLTGYTANDGTGNGLALSLARAQAAKATLAAMGKGFVFKMPSPLRTPNVNDGTVVGRGYYEQIPGGLAPNRRVSIAYEGTQTATGHNQFERQLLTITQPVDAKVPLKITLAGDMRIIRWDGAPKNGYAMRLILRPLNNFAEDKIVDEGSAQMDEATPRVRWAHYEASVDVPADGKAYTLEVQFQPPAGLARWANLGLWPHDQLGFFDVDQALIVKALVEHAQDAAMGKGDLGIGTRTPLTGVQRTKEYPFHERMPVGTALEWFTSIAHGVDIDCETTETSATIVTHFPRQGTPADIALVHGGKRSNVVSYKPLATSRRDLASSIIMQADESGASRPEAYASDRRALAGTLLESVVSAEGETPLSELQEGADVALAQSLNPRPGWEVSLDSAWTTRVLDEVHKGDIVRLVLPDEGVDGPHRVEARTLDPGTDRVTSMTLVEA